MKKIILPILIIISVFVLVGCKKEVPDPNPNHPIQLTPFEKVQAAKEALNLGEINHVTTNLVFPKLGLHDVVISWESKNPNIISNAGAVIRPLEDEEDITVLVIAKLTFGSSVDNKYFNIVVKKIPSDNEGKLNEIAHSFVLFPDNTVTTDTMVLPRIADQHLVYLTYEIDKPHIIDYDGNVNKTSVEQTVNITVSFNLGDLNIKKIYSLKVIPKSTDSVIITENDSRILKRIIVTNKVELVAATKNVKPGDCIVLEDGVYRSVNIDILTSGTKEHPIFITAKNPGKAKIEGESSIEVIADHVVIANLLITNGYPDRDRGVVIFKGNHLRLSNCHIDSFDITGQDYKWVSLTGKYHEIDRNIFENKKTGGSLFTIWRDDDSPQFHHIYLNQFKNYKNGGGLNGYETIRVGTSNNSQSDSYVTIERNLFEEVNGEIEIISIKAGRTIISDNTFVKCVGMVTSRHGKNNLIEGNIFLANNINDTGGIRLYDGGHIIRNNYIEKTTTTSNTRGGIVIHSGNSIPGGITVLNSQWTPYNVLIENNTFIDCLQSILFCGKYAYPPIDIIIKNNYMEAKTGTAAIRFDKKELNATFENNLFYASILSDSKSVITPTELLGVILNKTTPNTPVDSQGLKLNQSYGAKNLAVYNNMTTGTTWR